MYESSSIERLFTKGILWLQRLSVVRLSRSRLQVSSWLGRTSLGLTLFIHKSHWVNLNKFSFIYMRYELSYYQKATATYLENFEKSHSMHSILLLYKSKWDKCSSNSRDLGREASLLNDRLMNCRLFRLPISLGSRQILLWLMSQSSNLDKWVNSSEGQNKPWNWEVYN